MSKLQRRHTSAFVIAAVMIGTAGSSLMSRAATAGPVPDPVPAETSIDPALDLGVPDAEADTVDTGTSAPAGPSVSTSGRAQGTTTKPRTTTVSANATGLYGSSPVRLADTRTSAPIDRGQQLSLAIAGTNGIPANATAAVINLTVTRPTAGGFVTASPCGAAYGTSTLNFNAGQTIANLAVVSVGEGGAICITPSVATDLVVDVSGYVAPGGQLYTPVPAIRIVDTRQGGAAVEAGAPTSLRVAGLDGVPATGAQAVAVNVTIAGAAADGYATVYPCGGDIPVASNVNFTRNGAAANSVVAALDPSGSICVVTSVRAHLIVDLTGWFGTTGTEVQPAQPIRLADTRTTTGRVKAGTELQVMSAPGALGTVVNVTVTGAVAGGYLTVWPCGSPRPNTSAVNFNAGQTIANAVLAQVSNDGRICLSPSVDAHLIVDRTAVLGLAGSGSLDSTGSVVTDWAVTQVGDVYAAMNPYRFGDSKYGKAWDCNPGETACSKVDTQGKTRTTNAGAYVYDCSGLVVAAWLRAGVDLVKLGASWTEPMLTKLPPVTRETAQVGDLVMFDFDPTDADPVDHVGLYLSPTEMVHAGTCPGGTSAVCRTTINWSKVTAVLRPPSG